MVLTFPGDSASTHLVTCTTSPLWHRSLNVETRLAASPAHAVGDGASPVSTPASPQEQS